MDYQEQSTSISTYLEHLNFHIFEFTFVQNTHCFFIVKAATSVPARLTSLDKVVVNV